MPTEIRVLEDGVELVDDCETFGEDDSRKKIRRAEAVKLRHVRRQALMSLRVSERRAKTRASSSDARAERMLVVLIAYKVDARFRQGIL